MKLLDELAPNFRRALSYWPGAPLLSAHYDDLSETFNGSRSSLVELTKSFLECVCITILQDHGIRPDSNSTTTGLLKKATTTIGLIHKRGENSFDKVLSSFFRLTDVLNDLRNSEGAVSHGKDGFLDELCENQGRIMVLTTDAVLGLLLSSLEGVEPNLAHTRRPFETFEHFNEKIDAVTSCSIDVVEADEGDEDSFGQTIVLEFTTPELEEGVSIMLRPSELLFSHDRGAYVEVLNSARLVPCVDDEEEPLDEYDEESS